LRFWKKIPGSLESNRSRCDRRAPSPSWRRSRRRGTGGSRRSKPPATHTNYIEVTREDLDWFADLRGWGGRRADSPLAHYRYSLIEKRSGRLRLIEAPKPRLKAIQRRILDDVLASVPEHEAVHGFRKRRSIVTFAEPHAGRQAVLKMDLRDFFPSIRRARVSALFRTMGYPETTADLLAGLATNRTPREVWPLPATTATPTEREQLAEARDLHTSAHLPQGSPTSPALANLCFYRADCRLSALAEAADARYTRYADDLAFSGDRRFARSAHDFAVRAAVLIAEEGFAVEHRKTRIMRSGVRQRLAGVVVNQRVNVERREYDRLKAILTNCIRSGPQDQNRDGRPDFRGYLEGRTAFVSMIHPGKGARLRKLLSAIDWG